MSYLSFVLCITKRYSCNTYYSTRHNQSGLPMAVIKVLYFDTLNYPSSIYYESTYYYLIFYGNSNSCLLDAEQSTTKQSIILKKPW